MVGLDHLRFVSHMEGGVKHTLHEWCRNLPQGAGYFVSSPSAASGFAVDSPTRQLPCQAESGPLPRNFREFWPAGPAVLRPRRWSLARQLAHGTNSSTRLRSQKASLKIQLRRRQPVGCGLWAVGGGLWASWRPTPLGGGAFHPDTSTWG
jgi:hypothetical protein